MDYQPEILSHTLGNGRLRGRYLRQGRIVFYHVYFEHGSTTALTSSPIDITLPTPQQATSTTSWLVGAEFLGTAKGFVAGTDYTGIAVLGAGVVSPMSDAGLWNSAIPGTWADGSTLVMSGWYECNPRATELYDLLRQQATQGLAINSNDPVIRMQVDAYGAQAERARRDSLADAAEHQGSLANLRGEERLGYERRGQQVGAFEAELVGRELQARREEIAQALQLSANFLSTEQHRELQRQIALLDNAIAQQNAATSGMSVSQDWMEALLQNAQFLNDLEARERDRRSYYDLVQQGLL